MGATMADVPRRRSYRRDGLTIHRGAWSKATVYQRGDQVTSGDNLYRCIAENVGNAPPNTTWWEMLTDVVSGPDPSTDSAVAAFDGTTGRRLKNTDVLVSPTGLIVPKAPGSGMKVDTTTATYSWMDLLGSITTRTGGGVAATYAPLRPDVFGWRFTNGGPEKEVFIEFHIPHDYVPGTDMFVHVHWAQDTVDTGGPAGVPGTVEWRCAVSYADGHGTPGGAADPFPAAKIVTLNQQGSTTQYGHMIAEAAWTSDGGSATTFDRNAITVDGVVTMRVYRDSTWAGDTLNQNPFIMGFVDLHYQSTGIGTKQKAPDFYT